LNNSSSSSFLFILTAEVENLTSKEWSIVRSRLYLWWSTPLYSGSSWIKLKPWRRFKVDIVSFQAYAVIRP